MSVTELRTKSATELEKLLVETKQTLMENKRSLAAGELPNPRVVGKNRRLIAQIHSLMSEKANDTSTPSTDRAMKGDA